MTTRKLDNAAAQKISPTGQEILNYLRARGGSSAVGIIGTNRTVTIKHLRKLESAGLIVCVVEPEKRKLPNSYVGISGIDLNCGVWKIADPPVEKRDGQILTNTRKNH